jgi:type II secretory pathway pseudopilin PulG
MNKKSTESNSKKQDGFTALEVVLMIIVIGVISFAGFYAYTQNDGGQDNQEGIVAQDLQDTSLHESDESIPPDVFEVEIGETGSFYGSQITVKAKSTKNAEYIGLPTINEVQGNPHESNNSESNSEFEDNRRYLVMDFTITNKSPNPNTYAYDYFSLETSSKEIIQAIPLMTNENSWSETTIAPGGSFSAKIAFPIDKKEGSTVIWQGPYWVTSSEDVRVSL